MANQGPTMAHLQQYLEDDSAREPTRASPLHQKRNTVHWDQNRREQAHQARRDKLNTKNPSRPRPSNSGKGPIKKPKG